MAIRRVTSPLAPEPPPERWSNCLVVDGMDYQGTRSQGERSIFKSTVICSHQSVQPS